jgi:hypothetical protein
LLQPLPPSTTSSLPELAGALLFDPHCAPTTTALFATLAAATAPQLLEPAVASLAGPRCSPGPGHLVPRKFPGKKGIMCPTMIPFVSAIFSLMDRIQTHVKGNSKESKIDNNKNEDDDGDLVF